MFDERAGDNDAPKLSGGLSLGPLSSRRIQVSVFGPPRKTDLRCTYKGQLYRYHTRPKFSPGFGDGQTVDDLVARPELLDGLAVADAHGAAAAHVA